MTRLGPVAAIDALTRLWWRLVGRPVDLTATESWLLAPTSPTARVDDRWIAAWADQVDGHHEPGEGLLASMAALDGPGFRSTDLRPEVAAFYQGTSRWRIEVWTSWAWWARLPGAAIDHWFGRRLGQLAIPTDPLAVARGMDSRITVVTDGQGVRRGAGWHRTLRATGQVVFSGFYGTRTLPGADRPSIHVAFPLEQGNVQIFLRPEVTPEGGLLLRSEHGRFGDDGAYVVVRWARRTFAARVPLHERFHVHVDPEGVLRTDHELRLWRLRAVRLHYRLDPAT